MTHRRSLGDWLADRLSRVTSSGEFIPEIDGLRFIAILAVVTLHVMAVYLIHTGRTVWPRLEDRSPLVLFAS